MFLCMPFNLLLRFGHLKKIDTFLRLYRLFSYRGKSCPISLVREFIDFSNLSWGHVFSRLLCVIISRLRKCAVSTHERPSVSVCDTAVSERRLWRVKAGFPFLLSGPHAPKVATAFPASDQSQAGQELTPRAAR